MRHADEYSDGIRRADDPEALVIEATTVEDNSNAWREDGCEVGPRNDIERWHVA